MFHMRNAGRRNDKPVTPSLWQWAQALAPPPLLARLPQLVNLLLLLLAIASLDVGYAQLLGHCTDTDFA